MKRVLFTLALALSGVFGVWYGFSTPKELSSPASPELDSATVLNPSKPMDPFSLVDTDGKTFTQNALLGHWTLMFFGYADCPDVCPKTLATMSELWNLLPSEDQKPDALRLLFISLDPKSDTPAKLKAFLMRFHPSFQGLTGDENTIQTLSKACSIYSWRDPKNQEGKPKIIDHSATLLLINPQGRIHALFSPPHQAQKIAEDLRTILKR